MAPRPQLALFCLAMCFAAAQCDRFKVTYAPGAKDKVGSGLAAPRRIGVVEVTPQPTHGAIQYIRICHHMFVRRAQALASQMPLTA